LLKQSYRWKSKLLREEEEDLQIRASSSSQYFESQGPEG